MIIGELREARIREVANRGVCQACPDQIIDNQCVRCPADAVFDAAVEPFGTTSLSTTVSAAGDVCPDDFWVEVVNGPDAFSRGASVLSARLDGDKPACDRPLSLELAELTGSSFNTTQTNSVESGWFTCTPGTTCEDECLDGPGFVFRSASELPAGTFRFGTKAFSGLVMKVLLGTTIPGPK